jgi:NNP family nitrate/nitrite transporter-like MFS transporter
MSGVYIDMDNVCLARSSPMPALAWTTVAFFAGFAGVSAFGPIVPKLKESMGFSPLHMSLLSASPALTGSLLRIPFGALVDRFGGKKPILILLGLTCMGLVGTTATFYFFPSPEARHDVLFLAWGILCGCGIATFSVGIPTVSYWYPQKKQGSALALYAGLGNLAPGLFALILPGLVLSVGFFLSYSFWLLLLVITVILFSLFMKDAPYFQYKEMGLEPDKDALLLACGEELIPSGKAMVSIRRAAANYRTWILTLFYFISFGGFIALTVWFPTFWKESFSASLVHAGYLTALYSLSASLWRVAGGYVADRMGGEKAVTWAFVVMLAGSICIMMSSQSMEWALGGMGLMALGMGFANAAVFKLVPKYMPEIVGGTAGIVGGLGAFGGFVIPVVLGLFVDLSGKEGYARGFSVFAILSAASLVIIALFLRKAAADRRPVPSS